MLQLAAQQQQAPPLSALKIIRERCVKCHSGDKPPNGLRLDSVDNMVRGGKRGPAVVPFKPDESLIYQALNGCAGCVWNSKGFVIMPPGSQLSTDEIITIRKWILGGAHQYDMSGREP